MLRTSPTSVVVLIAAPVLAQSACELQRVVSPSEVRTHRFTNQVATNGRQWLAADNAASTLCGGPPIECGTGAVFSYEMLDGQLVHRQAILPPDTRLYDGVGSSIDVDGDRLIVGIGAKQWPGSSLRTGAVYIYEFDGEEWVESARIQPPPEVESAFGAVVSLDGSTAIVKRGNVDRLYRYESVGDGWELRQTIDIPDMLPRSCFGCYMTSGDGWYFFGTYLDSSVSREGGSVYVYRQQPDGSLAFTQKIAPEGAGWFGGALDFNGRTLAVGAPLAERNFRWQGVVQTYELEGERWVMRQEFTHHDPAELTQFGSAIVMHDDLMLVRATGENMPWIVRGMVYAFRRGPDGLWRQDERLEPDPPRWAGNYGGRMATDGRMALIGAPDDQTATGGVVGAAYLFDLECGDCTPDLDGDGALTVFDFLTFLNLFQDGDPIADFDGDGELTIFDFLAFQTAFDAGC